MARGCLDLGWLVKQHEYLFVQWILVLLIIDFDLFIFFELAVLVFFNQETWIMRCVSGSSFALECLFHLLDYFWRGTGKKTFHKRVRNEKWVLPVEEKPNDNSAEDRTRTCTGLHPLDPESSASTSSATSARQAIPEAEIRIDPRASQALLERVPLVERVTLGSVGP